MATEPYVTPLDHALAPGSQIVVRGTLVGNQFDINLSTGPDLVYRKNTGDDIALHITYSRGSKTIILNSFERGAWQSEERYNGSLIREQALFEIRVVVQADRFEILVDNIKLADFRHRIPPQAIRVAYIVGDLSLQLVDVGNQSPSRQIRSTKAHALEQLDPSILAPGNAITVRGVPTGAKFDINLAYGPDMIHDKPTGDNVALHVSYSGGSRRIILNSFENGQWGAEEQCDASSIQQGVPFEIRILIDQGRFGIFLNGQQLAFFNYRLPLERVQYIYVVGDINLEHLDLGGRAARQTRDTQQQKAHALEKLEPSALAPGNAIIVRGVPAGAKFDINLSSGPDMVYLKPTGDNIGLHVSYSGGSRRIILNSFENGHWGTEEQHDAPTIQQGVPFEIRIVPDNGRFGIYVDGQKLADFTFRQPLNQVHYIYIVGDVNLQSLNTGVTGGTPSQPQHDAPAPSLPYPSVLPVPYRLKFPHTLAPGQKLVIVGAPNPDAAKFHVNLYANHLNAFQNLVDFHAKTVHRDSRSKGEDWDKKVEADSKSGFPYTPGKQFQLVYAAQENAFEVYVDGVHHYTYNHRLPLNKINALGIEGNLKLHSVKLE